MKKIILVFFVFFLSACGQQNVLECEKNYYVQELGKKIELTTRVKYRGEKMNEYFNEYKMILEGENQETIDNLFESMKNHYLMEDDNPGIKQSFEKSQTYILYQIVYDITYLEEDEENPWQTKQEIKEELELDGYVCK